MAELIDNNTRQELVQLLGKLHEPVQLIYFTQANACPTCRQQLELLQELAGVSDKIKLQVYDFIKNSHEATVYHIDKIPATVVIGQKDYGIRFFGLTAGYEFSSFIETITMVGTGISGLPPDLETLIRQIDVPVHLEVMVTLTCPYCPRAVHAAHQLAMINENIRTDMVESAEFPQLAQRYDVSSVPKTVINEMHSFVGALPVENVYLEILKAVKPEEYRRIEQSIREMRGHRHVRKPEPDHIYDVVIIGGGPAAMSAAIYAARKDLDVLLIARELGGQITYTALVENYLGLPGIEGKELAEQFVSHVEQFPIAENLNSNAMAVQKQNNIFTIRTDDQKIFTGKSVIYCAGKEYRRSGAKGEEKFLGHGIAFCATCDAPLYQGMSVAVVGGGNSAFTSVRDLSAYAREIHLIHRRGTFTADPPLVAEVTKIEKITVHTDALIEEFLGDKKITGIRISLKNGKEKIDLPVQGVFLEIGLVPNSNPVKDLLKLTERGEIPVKKDNSTEIPGFFAAGDVTDVLEKQAIIAAGEGAKAAIATYQYLVLNKLVEKKVTDAWG